MFIIPIPNPRKNEKRDDFISRCMGDKTMNKEYPDNKQRAAICNSSWRQAKGISKERDIKEQQKKK